MLTKDKTQQIVYQILQFCSLIMVSYLTYSKIYRKKFQSIICNSNHELRNFQEINGRKYSIYIKFASASEKHFGKFYLISYIITNFTCYFILIMLCVCKPKQNKKSSFTSQWTMLVYIPYSWIFFAKLYHNEIVKYFVHLRDLNDDSLLVDKIKVQSRIDTIILWLKILIFNSLLCFVFCIKQFSKNGDESTLTTAINSLWFVHLVCAWCIFVNSVLSLSCFQHNQA